MSMSVSMSMSMSIRTSIMLDSTRISSPTSLPTPSNVHAISAPSRAHLEHISSNIEMHPDQLNNETRQLRPRIGDLCRFRRASEPPRLVIERRDPPPAGGRRGEVRGRRYKNTHKYISLTSTGRKYTCKYKYRCKYTSKYNYRSYREAGSAACRKWEVGGRG